VSRTRKLGIVGAVLILGIAAATVFLPGDDPLHEGKTVTGWALQLHAPDPAQRAAAQEMIRKLGPEAVPELRRLLRMPELVVRNRFWKNATSIPQPLRHWTAVVVGARKTTQVIPAACEAVCVIGPGAVAAVPDLAELLSRPDREISHPAARALGHLGPGALPALASALQSTNAEVRKLAAFGLGEAGPIAIGLATNLVEALHDPNKDVRETAVAALSRLGRGVLPILLDGLSNPDPLIGRGAAVAIAASRAPYILAFDALAGAAQSPDAGLRAASVRAIGELAGFHPRMIEVLRSALKDPSPEVQLAVLAALKARGKYAGQASADVAVFLANPAIDLRLGAAAALGYLAAPGDQEIVARLRTLADTGTMDDQAAAREALKVLAARAANPGNPGSVP